MSTIQITDNVDASVDLQIRDDSPLAKAKLTQLVSTAKSLIGDLTKPVNQTDISTVSLGAQFSAPSSLIEDTPALTINGGVNSDLVVLKPADKLLFDDDGFSPVIPIAANQCWVGFEVDAKISAGFSATADGFGVAIQGSSAIGITSYTLFEAAVAGPFPILKDAVLAALQNFSASVTAQNIRQQSSGTVNVVDVGGSVSVTGSYELPLSLSAFASADLPFNFSLSVAPTATVKVAGSLCISGDFIVRSYKISDSLVRLGVYKKKGSTLAASLSASVGIGVVTGDTDLLGAVLNAALPGVDVSKTGMPADTAKALNGVIKDGLDRSIAISLNAICSAAITDEAAVLYEIQLNQGDADKTNAAMQSALRGDWTTLDYLGNAKRLRNILVETKEKKRALSLNLLGFYNATSVADYVSRCTILRDDTGQLTIVDSEAATRIAATTTPYASDSNKLRLALAQDFITTASYAVVGGRLNAGFTIVQDYFDYANAMSVQQMRNDVLLGSVLQLIPAGTFDQILARSTAFSHAKVSLNQRFDNAAVMSIFFSNPTSRIPRTRAELENVGRKVMAALLNPSDTIDSARIAILQNDTVWSTMDENGNATAFGLIPELQKLNPNQLADVKADWTSIVWWAKSVAQVAPVLVATLNALDKIVGDPTKDPEFMKQRSTLAAALESVARDTEAAFVNTWGPAVIFALSGQHSAAQMDIAWDSNSKHFERG